MTDNRFYVIYAPLREVGDVRRQSTETTPASRAGGAWVFWAGTADFMPIKAFSGNEAEKDCTKYELEFGAQLGKKTDVRTRCFPDTVDPRGPKGK